MSKMGFNLIHVNDACNKRWKSKIKSKQMNIYVKSRRLRTLELSD